MDIPKTITPQDFSRLWEYVAKEEGKIRKVSRRNELCAKVGHIVFHCVLAVLGFLFGMVLGPMDEEMIIKKWYAQLADAIMKLLNGIAGEETGIKVVIIIASAVILLLAIPFVASAICKLCTGLMKCRTYVYEPPMGTPLKKNAQMMIDRIYQISQKAKYTTWEDYYPMSEIGDIIEVNVYNYIPWLCLFASAIIAFFAGYQFSGEMLFGYGILSAILSFLLLLVIVPLWKLSSIINSVFFSYAGRYDLGELSKKLGAFVQECEKAEEERQERFRQQQEAEEKKRKEEQLKKADELYRMATQGDAPIMGLLKEAAELGSPAACLEYGKRLYLESISGNYTRDEREELCEDAAVYLEDAKDLSVEAEFLWLACRITFESHDSDGWHEMLNQARRIQKSKNLPGNYQGSLEEMIKLLVEQVDKTTEQEHLYQNTRSIFSDYVSTGISESATETTPKWDGAGANALPWGTGMTDCSGV